MGKAVFWDFDGTLVYSNSLWGGSVHRLLLSLGERRFSFAEVRQAMHIRFPWHTELRLKGRDWWVFVNGGTYEALSDLGVPEKTAKRVARLLREEILSPHSYYFYEDTLYALEKTAELGYESYLLSNNYPELKEVAEKLGLLGYFKEVIVSGEIGLDKPGREIFHHALRLAGNPKEAVMIGDNLEADVKGAENAGFSLAILVHRPGETKHFCPTLKDAVALLER